MPDYRSGLPLFFLTSTMPSADFCNVLRESRNSPSPSSHQDALQISQGKLISLRCTPAGFTNLALDGYGLRDLLPTRPADIASRSSFCSSGRNFASHFLQTTPRGLALVLR